VVELLVAILNFFLVKSAVTVFVERFEHGGKFFLLLLANELTGHVSQSSLLKNLVSSEVLEVSKDVSCLVVVYGVLNITEPGVSEGLLCTRAFLVVNGQKLGNEIFSLPANALPLGGREFKLTPLNHIKDSVIVLAEEGSLS